MNASQHGHSEHDPLDPSKDVCQNCGRPRAEHKFTRGGAVCASGRRFKLDAETVKRVLLWTHEGETVDEL